MRRVNENQMKFFMAVLMTLAGLQAFMPANLAVLYSLLGNVAVAWFAFAASEGVIYTSNIYRYAGRLYGGAVIMFLGNSILNTGFGMSSAQAGDNVFLTLALGVSALGFYQSSKLYCGFEKTFNILASATLSFCGFMCQYGYIMIPIMFISLILKEKPQKRDGFLILLSIIFLASELFSSGTQMGSAVPFALKGDFLFILVVPFLQVYDGKRGTCSFVIKWAFYLYYPVHIWLINIAANVGA